MYLSSSITELRSEYDVVIVGSGYGGAVHAARLAGLRWPRGDRGSDNDKVSVCVLERGREIRPGYYPKSLLGGFSEIRADGKRRLGRETAMFQIHVGRDVIVVRGSGLGGTSLINANVAVPPPENVWDDRAWPKALRGKWNGEGLSREEAFERAKEMLGVVEACPTQPADSDAGPKHCREPDPSRNWPRLRKYATLQTVAEELREITSNPGIKAQHLPIAVSFKTGKNENLASKEDPNDKEDPNGPEVLQRACVLCGDCVTGCNHYAKNTLIMNYLPVAKSKRAELFCGVEVRYLEPHPDGNGEWLVWYRLPLDCPKASPEALAFVRAKVVIVAAGTLGSTEILLRSRERGLEVSDHVGRKFSGNGDMFAFAYNLDPEKLPEEGVGGIGHGSRDVADVDAVGPTITGGIDLRDEPQRIMIEEGAVPGLLGLALRFLTPLASRLFHSPVELPRGQLGKRLRELISVIRGVRHGATRNTLTYLVMGEDNAGGRLLLDRGKLVTDWPGAGSQKYYRETSRDLMRVTERMRGDFVGGLPEHRQIGRVMVTVHPIGGCRTADDPKDGVVDADGCVFKTSNGPVSAKPPDRSDERSGPEEKHPVHEGLYVCDASIIPVPIRTNPLLTITALAERAADRIKSKYEWEKLGHIDDGKDEQEHKQGPGIRWSEQLSGWLGEPDRDDDRDDTPIRRRGSLVLDATILVPDLERMLRDPKHKGKLIGSARCAKLSKRPMTVTNGNFHLFQRSRSKVETLEMLYEFTLHSVEGIDYTFVGRKEMYDEPGFPDPWTPWSDLTTLEFRIEQKSKTGVKSKGPWRGELRISFAETVRLFSSLRATGARTRVDSIVAIARFVRFFLGEVYRTYFWIIGPRRWINPYQREKRDGGASEEAEKEHAKKEHARLVTSKRSAGDVDKKSRKEEDKQAKTYRCITPDHVEIRLTRPFPKKGPPVLLAPGFGMSTYCFRIPEFGPDERCGDRCSLSQYLSERGYDVWLLDYRASDLTPASRTQFTLDDIAKYDYPTAVTLVTKETGKKVQIVGHCVASATLLMALLKGYLRSERNGGNVRSVICSQVFMFVDHPWTNRFKATLRIPTILDSLGIWSTVTTDMDVDSSMWSGIWDRLLYLHPSRERCQNPVCRRIVLFYGEVVRHVNLDDDMHDSIYDMFDRANISTFRHLELIVRHGKLIDRFGNDVYVTPENARRNLNLPITLVQGLENRLFQPSGGRDSYAWLRKHGGHEINGETGFQDHAQETLGEKLYKLVQLHGYGHLDTLIGKEAAKDGHPYSIIVSELTRQYDLGEKLKKP